MIRAALHLMFVEKCNFINYLLQLLEALVVVDIILYILRSGICPVYQYVIQF